MVRLYAALFAIGLVVYGLFAWDRLGRQSEAPHFVYQADAWLHGSIEVQPPLPNDDWAVLETVTLDDGSRVTGRRMVSRRAFLTLSGDELPIQRVTGHAGWTHHVSFPALPTIVMIPSALVAGRAGNDVIPTVLLAALILPLTLLVLRRVAAAGLSTRTVRDDLWLVAMLAFGSVLFFSAIQGKVWYTAHVLGVVLALVYTWASIEARHPVIAGLALGAAALTRTSMAFMFPLFLFELWRMAAKEKAAEVPPSASAKLNLAEGRAAMRKAIIPPLVRFAIPVAAFAILGMIYNHVRFGAPTEFGHTFIALGDHRPVVQQTNIETWGLASYHYLSRNLAVAFTLLPDLLPRSPWIKISGHGLAIWFTTPVLLFLLWPRVKNPLHRPLWITTLLVALPSLLYMNSGWFQFGYRFALDYLVFLVVLLAIGGRPFGRVAKVLIVAGIVVNLFGAYTFARRGEFYGGQSTVVVTN